MKAHHPKAESKLDCKAISPASRHKNKISSESKESKVESKPHHKEKKYDLNNDVDDDILKSHANNEAPNKSLPMIHLHPKAAEIVKGLQIKSISMRNASNGKLIWTSKQQIKTDIFTTKELQGESCEDSNFFNLSSF